eukprot:8231835-Ditylum_brightwellii.AAC.1
MKAVQRRSFNHTHAVSSRDIYWKKNVRHKGGETRRKRGEQSIKVSHTSQNQVVNVDVITYEAQMYSCQL